MDRPKIKVFINQGRIDAVYSSTTLVDVEVISVNRSSCEKRFYKEYDKAENEGMEYLYYKETKIDEPWYGDAEYEEEING